MDLENLGVQEMNTHELMCIDGGGFWDHVVGAAIAYVVENVMEAAANAFIDHCNSGGGYGGSMDTHGKL